MKPKMEWIKFEQINDNSIFMELQVKKKHNKARIIMKMYDYGMNENEMKQQAAPKSCPN